MNHRGNIFNPTSWSLTVKFFIVFLLMILVIFAAVLFITTLTLNELRLDNSRQLLAELGRRQSTVISSSVNNARDVLEDFSIVQSNSMLGLLLSQLRIGDSLDFQRLSSADFADILRNDLLILPASPFESVRLLDTNGRSISQATRSRPLTGDPSGARAPSFITASNAAERGEQRAVAVSQVNFIPIVEVIQVLRWRDGSAIGYLVGRLNNNQIFLDDLLPLEEGTTPTNSFLVTLNDVLISPLGVRPNVIQGARSIAADRALDGQEGSALYTADDGIEYLGYYAPIRGTPLGYIVQSDVEIITTGTNNVLLPRRFAIFVGGLGVVIIGTLIFSQIIIPPLNRLRQNILGIAYGDTTTKIEGTQRGDEIGELATSLETMREQIRGQIQELQANITTRTRDIEATQEVSRFAATQRDLGRLMDSVVNLIIDRFPSIYHAQIFLIDADGNNALLRASTGTVGNELLQRGHRLGVGSVSVIGQVTAQGQMVLARDTALSQVHRRNEFLPDTRAELAIPLRIGEIIIGALDVQSKEADAFDDEIVTVLQIMADQIAVAIQNARLFEEVTRRLEDIEDRNRQATLRAWQDFMRERRANEISRDAGLPSQTNTSALKQAALRSGELTIGKPTVYQTTPVALPITLRGQVLGVVEWEVPTNTLTDDKIELARELASRLAISLDNARLFQESQRTAERERVVNSIVAKLTAQTNINEILQTAVREVGTALRAPQVNIRLNAAALPKPAGKTEPLLLNGSAADKINQHASVDNDIIDSSV